MHNSADAEILRDAQRNRKSFDYYTHCIVNMLQTTFLHSSWALDIGR